MKFEFRNNQLYLVFADREEGPFAGIAEAREWLDHTAMIESQR